MKVLHAVAIIVIAISVLTACGMGDSPERAAEEWLESSLNMDGNTLMERTCAEQQESVQEAGLWLSVFGILGQLFTGQQTQTDISDLRFNVVNETGNTAHVRVTGQIRTAVLAFAQTQEVDEEWLMVQEDGKWKWCGY